MKRNTKFVVAGAFVSALLASSAPHAFAWSCVAVADDGTYGYSYNYPNKKGARQRAKAECSERTYDDCHVTSCDPNG
ncbi:MAG: hypothetical protein JWM58_3799 [Rhizobium sp.]|nr:hypothetical protein [Rhizobium sp.]